jgi:two-component system alkaline phosphatase synthesis response regulator PhoP
MISAKKTILFLEDEEELLDTVGNLLQDQGYNVVKIGEAEKALELMRELVPDLILADIKLPGMDGFDFFHEIKKSKQLGSVPFMFITAFNDMSAMMYAKKAGAVEYITKPFEFEYLIARVKHHVPP